MKQLLVLLLPALLIFSCKEKNPFFVSSLTFDPPSTPAQVDRERLVQNHSFEQAYLNGTIRSTQATISWKRCTDPDFLCYKIYRDNSLWVKDIDSAQTDSLVDTQLQQDTWYRYTIWTILKNGASNSDTVSIKTPKFQPPVWGDVRVDSLGGIFLNWSNRADIASNFAIERAISGLSYQAIAMTGAGEQSFIDTAVTSGKSYTYRLCAYNRYDGWTAYGNESIPVSYSMAVPAIGSVTQLGSTHTVRVKFTDYSNAETGFRIYRRSASGVGYAIIGRAAANATQFIDTDSSALATDSTYFYKVECFNRRHANVSTEMSVTIRVPKVEVSSSSIQFPKTTVGESAAYELTLRNRGSGSLAVSKIIASNPHFGASRTGFRVASGASVTLSITFTPTDTLEQTGTVTFVTDEGDAGNLSVAVGGRGTSSASSLSEEFEGGPALPARWTSWGGAAWIDSVVVE